MPELHEFLRIFKCANKGKHLFFRVQSLSTPIYSAHRNNSQALPSFSQQLQSPGLKGQWDPKTQPEEAFCSRGKKKNASLPLFLFAANEIDPVQR